MKVFTSQIKGIDLDAEVKAYIAALEGHRTTVGIPAPVAHPIVEGCVKRVQYPISAEKPDDFVADYVIEDDAEYT